MWNFRALDARAIVLKLKAFLLQDDLLKMIADELGEFVADGFLQLAGTDTLSGFVGDGFLQLAGTDTLGTSALGDTATFTPAGTDTLGTTGITDSVSATG